MARVEKMELCTGNISFTVIEGSRPGDPSLPELGLLVAVVAAAAAVTAIGIA
jgi:hypothetical protein